MSSGCSFGNKQQAAEWKNEEDEILIDFVKAHECLYNVQCQDYRKTQLKQSLWHEISQILNKTDCACSKRWAYIRDYYIRRRGKPGTGSVGEAAKKRSQLLSFLDSFSSGKRSTVGNIVDTGNNTEDLSREDIVTQQNLAEELNESQVLNENDTNQIMSRIETENIDLLKTTPSVKRKCSSVKYNTSHSEERLKLLKEIAERQHKKNARDEEDANDLFFLAMSKIVKKLPERNQAQVRLEVGSLVSKAEIKYLTKSSPDYRPLPSSDASLEYSFSSENATSLLPSSAVHRMQIDEDNSVSNSFHNFSSTETERQKHFYN